MKRVSNTRHSATLKDGHGSSAAPREATIAEQLTHWQENGFLNFQAKLPNNHLVKTTLLSQFIHPAQSSRTLKNNHKPFPAQLESKLLVERRLKLSPRNKVLWAVSAAEPGRVRETPARSHLGPCDPERRLRSPAVRFGAVGDGEDRLEWLPNVSLRSKSTGPGARKVKRAAR